MVLGYSRIVVAAMLSGLTFCASAHADGLQAIDSVLARIGKSSVGEKKGVSPAAALMRDVEAFRSRAPQLAAPVAAAQWLELWDRSLTMDAQRAAREYDAYDALTQSPVGARSLLAALPPPEAWPSLRTQAAARAKKKPEDVSALGLRLLTELLVRDAAAAQQSLAAFERLAGSRGSGERELKLLAVNDARALVYKLYGTREQIAEGFLATVDVRARQPYGMSVGVPDLVGLLGPARAEALLTQALRKPVGLHVPEGAATKALARELALRHIGSLRKPQWGLVDGIGTAALYEALQARFDPRAGTAKAAAADEAEPQADYARRQADLYYFIDLVIAGRHADAERAMVRASGGGDWLGVPRQAMSELAQKGHNAAVRAFLADLLGRRPQLPAWDFYLEQAGVLGRSDESIALLDAVLKRTDLTPHLRASLLEKRLDALLAADQVDAAAAGFRMLLAAPPTRDDARLAQRTTAAIRLAGLGRVLKQPGWSRLGLDYAARALALPSGPQSHWRTTALRSLLAELRRQGATDAAQALVLAELEREGEDPGFAGLAAVVADPAKRSALVELVGLYDAAGRPADVLSLLDEVGVWGARDLAELVADKDSMGTPVGLMAARALKAGGNVQGAMVAARAVMAQLPNHDPAYQLFVDLAGEASISELDRMAARDPFEERPLVWKAVALARAHRYEAAEESARRAIAIDPSDGEQGVNDRMRAYAVLADALEGKGDPAAAQGLRRAVAAIRLSEQADELHKLGLYQRAFAGYRAALAEFSDAYCIQSRLAVQLGRSGHHEEALKHYRRAFELMPESFGRVESHCFGCESVFAGPSAQAVAEEVFTGLHKRGAGQPQVEYMLGYLRKEQGRYEDAATLFRRAIALDALYLNAWRQLNDLGEKTYIDPGERDIARLRLFELDPGQIHVRYQLDEVADLPSLWRAIDRFAGKRAGQGKAAPVYPLQGSIQARQEALGKLPPEMRLQMEQYVEVQEMMLAQWGGSGRGLPSLGHHKLLLAALRVMGVEADARGDE
jgi:tetratricopeptide (TPR) repeat protein